MTPFRRYTGCLTTGPNRYLASPKLQAAVNTALQAEQPLLVTGEPGVGKTRLAYAIAEELGLPPPLEFHTRSDHQARDILYTFDTMRRFYDAHIGRPEATDPKNYRHLAPLGEAIASQEKRVVLIDEIDKAPRDFPNDLLDVLDRMRFTIPETGEQFPRPAPAQRDGDAAAMRAAGGPEDLPAPPPDAQPRTAPVRPIVVVTSNSERQLPEPFLRRCVYHHIAPPDETTLRSILALHLGGEVGYDALVCGAMKAFLALRARRDLDKSPGTGELLIWVKVLLREGLDPAALPEPEAISKLPYLGALIKTEADVRRVEAA